MLEQEFNKPMVDVLSEVTKRTVVMSDTQYVYLDTKEMVELEHIEAAQAQRVQEVQEFELKAKQQEAQAYLDSTDWYVTRKSETGVAIPQEVLTKRAECRELL